MAFAALCVAAAPANSVAEAVASVVEVRAPGSTGTGFVIDGDRVVTAAHVVESSPVTVATSDGSRSATIRVYEPDVDLAVLEVEGGLDIQPLELSEKLPGPAEDVYAATAQPFGGTATVSRGIVSGIVEQAPGQVVQTDAAVNPGSSGGPLLSADGVVLGVTSSKLDGAEGVAFAIPSPTLIEVLSQDGRGGTDIDGTSAPVDEGEEVAGVSPDRNTGGLLRDWLPVAAPAALLLMAVLIGGVLEHRRRRRPPPPGPFEIDVQLHDARTPVQARPDRRKDV